VKCLFARCDKNGCAEQRDEPPLRCMWAVAPENMPAGLKARSAAGAARLEKKATRRISAAETAQASPVGSWSGHVTALAANVAAALI
jgi:hypothetical protein